MAGVPVFSPVEVQCFIMLVSVSVCPSGLGFMNPLRGDEQLVSEKAFLLCRLFSVLKGAVLVQDLPHSTLSKATNPLADTAKTQQTRSIHGML